MALIPSYRPQASSPPKKQKTTNGPVNQNVGAPPAPRVKPPKVPASSYSQTPAVQQVTPNIHDSTYGTNAAKLLWTRNNTIQTADTGQFRDDQDLTTALGRRAQRLPNDLQNAKNNANKAGLFYSGAYGKQVGDIQTQYGNDVADLNTGYTRRTEDRQSARDTADANYLIGMGDNEGDAASRQVQRDIANPPVPVAKGVVSAGGTGSVNLYTELDRLKGMANTAKGDKNALKNVAAYWKTYTAELKKNGWEVPSVPSAIKPYV